MTPQPADTPTAYSRRIFLTLAICTLKNFASDGSMKLKEYSMSAYRNNTFRIGFSETSALESITFTKTPLEPLITEILPLSKLLLIGTL